MKLFDINWNIILTVKQMQKKETLLCIFGMWNTYIKH